MALLTVIQTPPQQRNADEQPGERKLERIKRGHEGPFPVTHVRKIQALAAATARFAITAIRLAR